MSARWDHLNAAQQLFEVRCQIGPHAHTPKDGQIYALDHRGNSLALCEGLAGCGSPKRPSALWGNRSCGPGTRSCWRTRAWPDSMSRWPRGSGRGGYLRLSYWLVGHMVDVECLARSLGSAKHQPKCAFALAKMSTSRVLGIAPIIAGASYPLEYEYSSEKPIAEKARSSSECNSYRIEAGATVGSRVERANAVQSERRLLTSMRSS